MPLAMKQGGETAGDRHHGCRNKQWNRREPSCPITHTEPLAILVEVGALYWARVYTADIVIKPIDLSNEVT